MRVRSESVLQITWTVAYQAPQSMEFSRQEYWSRLPFPSPGDLPNPGIDHTSGFSLMVDLDLSHFVRFTGHFRTYSDKMYF